jgi:predicted secreted protein
MTTQQIREAVKGAYKNHAWRKRVDSMSDDQVQAIYLRLKSQDKLKEQ